jgi:arabinose-5-phosphate isomerase
VSLLKSFNYKIIAIVGNTNSFLAKQSDVVINSTVEKEADINNLAPTSSTTAQLIMADAIAMTLVYLKGFKSQDFAKFHLLEYSENKCIFVFPTY